MMAYQMKRMPPACGAYQWVPRGSLVCMGYAASGHPAVEVLQCQAGKGGQG
jgi:hypothetical protein